LPEIKRLGLILKKMRVSILVLTGGEPFIRKDIIEIAKLFKAYGLEVRFQTNGFLLTPELINELGKLGTNGITISLDSLKPEIQDGLTNFKNSHEKIFKALSLVSQYSSKTKNISAINTVVSKLNIEELPTLARFATEMGLFISFIPLHSTRSNSDFIIRKNNAELEFSEKDFWAIDKVYSELIRMKKEGYLIYNSSRFLRETSDYLRYKKIHWKCDSPNLYFAISPSGNFLPCVDLNSDINILDQDFLKNFSQGIPQNQIRQKVDACEGCMYACWPEFTYLMRDWHTLVEQIKQFSLSLRCRSKPFSDQEIKLMVAKLENGAGRIEKKSDAQA
jgi:cyclic pyranopterin phosphate synthase